MQIKRLFVLVSLLSQPVSASPVGEIFAGRVPDEQRVGAEEWRLFSFVFAAMPAEGYPISFRADGRIVQENLAGAVGWRPVFEGLELLDEAGDTVYRLSYDRCQGALESWPEPLGNRPEGSLEKPGLTLRLASQAGSFASCSGCSPVARPFCCRPCGSELRGADLKAELSGPLIGEVEEGPGVFEIQPSDPSTWSSILPPETFDRISANRHRVAAQLLAELEDRGSRTAALLLAWLGDERALPELRRRLLTESDTYGWETSTPLLFSEGNHRGYHAYSRAIEHLTGRPLEQAISLDPAEVEDLARRAATGDDTALIILHRLAPEVARQKIFELFRARPHGSCLEEGNTIIEHQLIPPGASKSEALARLGPPDVLEDHQALYCCVAADWAGDFRLRFSGDRVLAFESELQSADPHRPWCESESRPAGGAGS